MKSDGNRLLRSGELARQLGISPDSLRLYERKGLLPRPPRSENGYRSYPPEALNRVRVIRAALSIGFTLEELAEIFSVRDRGDAPCSRVRELAGQKVKHLQRKIAALSQLRDQVEGVLKQWDKVLKKTAHGKRAGLLEALAAEISPGTRRLPMELYSSMNSVRKSIGKEPRK